jgi:hypothetical protein
VLEIFLGELPRVGLFFGELHSDEWIFHPRIKARPTPASSSIGLLFAFEAAGSIKGESRREYDHLEAATDVAWVAMADAGCTLVNTRPTTLAGILAALPVY